jgi:hypothetical protein
MKALATLLLCCCGAALAQTIPWTPAPLTGTYYYNNLPTNNLVLGTPALTVDQGPQYWNGATWQNSIVSTGLTPIAANTILCNPNASAQIPAPCSTLPPGFSVSTINGTSVPANSGANQVLITTAPQIFGYTVIPPCVGQVTLNYNASNQQFSCVSIVASGNATSVNGATVPVSAPLTGTNASGQFGSVSIGSNLTLSGGVLSASSTASTAWSAISAGSNANSLATTGSIYPSGTTPISGDVTANNVQWPSFVVSGVPSATNDWVYFHGTLSGTPVYTSARWAPLWYDFNNTVKCINTGTGGTGTCVDEEWYQNLIAGWDGFHLSKEDRKNVNAAPATNPSSVPYILTATVTVTGGSGTSGSASYTSQSAFPAVGQNIAFYGAACPAALTGPASVAVTASSATTLSWSSGTSITASSSTCTIASPSISTNVMTGVKGILTVNANMGGIAGSWGGGSGNIFGSNPTIGMSTGATALAYTSGFGEIDTNCAVGCTTNEKHSWTSVLNGPCTPEPCAAEFPGLYDNSGHMWSATDNNNSSFWHSLEELGSIAHASASSFVTHDFDAPRRFFGSSTEPELGGGRDYSHVSWATCINGTTAAACVTTPVAISSWSGANSTGTCSTSCTGPGVTATVTFAALASAPPIGAMIHTVGTGLGGVDCVYGCVILSSTTTTAVFASTSSSFCNSGCTGTYSIYEPEGFVVRSPGLNIDGPTGSVSTYGLNVGSAGISAGTSTMTAVNIVEGNGYTGGNYVGATTLTVCVRGGAAGCADQQGTTLPAEDGATPPTFNSSSMTYEMDTAMMIDPNLVNTYGVDAGCSNGDVITPNFGTHSVQATITLTVVGGHVTQARITNGLGSATPNIYTVMLGHTALTQTYTGGTCTIYPLLSLGFRIVSIAPTTAGSYPFCGIKPEVWIKSGDQLESPAVFDPVMSCAAAPLLINSPLAPVQYTIAGLPTCNSTGPPAGYAGTYAAVTNGVATPTYAGTPGTTGANIQPVFCNGSTWQYH